MEYAIYPFRFMNITQRHDKGNHLPHWKNSKNYSDKPWDEALQDSGRGYFEPRNDFVILEKFGSAAIAFTVILKSVKKLTMPSGRVDYLYLTLTHMNEDDFSKVKVGDILKSGSKILREGTSGKSTGNHFHITANVGKYYGFLQNSNGSWCFTYEKSLLPEEAFYLDSSYTTIKNAKGIKFTELPKPKTDYIGKTVARNEYKPQVEVRVEQLIVRDSPSLNGNRLGYANLGIYDFLGKSTDENYTWYKLNDLYAPSKDKWIVELEVKEEPKPPIEEPIEEPIIEPIEEEKEEPIIEEPKLDFLKVIKELLLWFKNLFKRK